jgi:hypothetical protein
MAITGIDNTCRVCPISFHQPQTPKSVIKALILTLEPTIKGSKILRSIRCIETTVITTNNTFTATRVCCKCDEDVQQQCSKYADAGYNIQQNSNEVRKQENTAAYNSMVLISRKMSTMYFLIINCTLAKIP